MIPRPRPPVVVLARLGVVSPLLGREAGAVGGGGGGETVVREALPVRAAVVDAAEVPLMLLLLLLLLLLGQGGGGSQVLFRGFWRKQKEKLCLFSCPV